MWPSHPGDRAHIPGGCARAYPARAHGRRGEHHGAGGLARAPRVVRTRPCPGCRARPSPRLPRHEHTPQPDQRQLPAARRPTSSPRGLPAASLASRGPTAQHGGRRTEALVRLVIPQRAQGEHEPPPAAAMSAARPRGRSSGQQPASGKGKGRYGGREGPRAGQAHRCQRPLLPPFLSSQPDLKQEPSRTERVRASIETGWMRACGVPAAPSGLRASEDSAVACAGARGRGGHPSAHDVCSTGRAAAVRVAVPRRYKKAAQRGPGGPCDGVSAHVGAAEGLCDDVDQILVRLYARRAPRRRVRAHARAYEPTSDGGRPRRARTNNDGGVRANLRGGTRHLRRRRGRGRGRAAGQHVCSSHGGGDGAHPPSLLLAAAAAKASIVSHCVSAMRTSAGSTARERGGDAGCARRQALTRPGWL